MEIHNFYLPSLKKNQKIAKIEEEEFFHLRKVLRLKRKEPVMVFNGRGLIARGEIGSISSSFALVKLDSFSLFHKTSSKTTLLQSIIKREKMDFILEKATELEVSRIIPVWTKHCVVKMREFNSKLRRWQRIMVQACKQAGNPWLPELLPPLEFKIAFKCLEANSLKFVFTSKTKNEIDLLLSRFKENVSVLIGPEGGFSNAEIKLAEEEGFLPLSLGKLRLRSETAGIFALSLIKILELLNYGRKA
jgi:16S rRNA (uracil1498-N3)-methyltransferase